MNHDQEPANQKHPRFIVREDAPFNGGPPLDLLAQAHLTPPALFFVRSHGAVPAIDPASYRCLVGGLVERERSFTLADLAALPQADLVATIQCAGNRRSELIEHAPIPNETAWGAEAIGTAVWRGVWLHDLLTAVGLRPGAGHVAFLGLDDVQKDGRHVGFGGSIPLEKALQGGVLLATEMNGQPLSPMHGYPLRVVVPGYIGARSVKWLGAISLQAAPSANYFQASAYRFAPAAPGEAGDDLGFPLGELSITSVICVPEAGARLSAGSAQVVGYAMAGGSRQVAQVELSTDQGRSWHTADMTSADAVGSWCLWRAQLDITNVTTSIIVRAWDTAANSQPALVEQVWNAKGYMNNAWHRVPVIVAGAQ